MSKMTSNKPYLIRAMYDWIVDNDLTPYLLVDAEHPDSEVPQEYVTQGRIVLNISPQASRGLHLEHDKIVFTARFSGQAVQIFVTPAAVMAIYAKENGRGMEFGPEYDEPATLMPASAPQTSVSSVESKRAKPVLTLVTPDPKDQE